MIEEKRKNLLKKRAILWWGVKDPQNLSDEALLEGVLNYGDLPDVREVFEILGIDEAARIFNKQIKEKRVNYNPQTLNYFKLFFKKYAFRDSQR